jgi:phosphatidylglycerol:prolipoprotein diacylglycerol transferase
MLPYPHIHPDLFQIGSLHVRWYGLMYALGFFAAYLLIPRQERAKSIGLRGSLLDALLFYVFIGLVAGARLGYILFYQYMHLADFVHQPLEIIAVWHGGMSFHGGLVGTVVAGWWFCRRKGLPFLAVADSVIVAAPIGLGLGRIGNFINGELYGRVTQLPWVMIFPGGGPYPRHPSQLYEAFAEGLVLFIALWLVRKRRFPDGMMVALFFFLYGLFRFFIEFTREPDSQLGLILGVFSMGQLLCMVMVAAALLIYVLRRKRHGISQLSLLNDGKTDS